MRSRFRVNQEVLLLFLVYTNIRNPVALFNYPYYIRGILTR